MYERLDINNRNPICSIATIHDHLWLNEYHLNQNLIYLACLKSFFIDAHIDVKGMPLFFIAPVENGIDMRFFKTVGFEVEYLDLNHILKDKESKNFIAYFDYYTLLSKEGRKKRYNICPIHTTLIIENAGSGWRLNEVEINEGKKSFSIRGTEKLIQANHIELYPYPVAGIAYRIVPQIHSRELEERTISLIDENLKKIVGDAEKCIGPVRDGTINLCYGLQAYDTLINFFEQLYQVFSNKAISEAENRRYGILLMTFRRFLLPLSGKGNFFRSEMAEAFTYYAKYKENELFQRVSDKLLSSANEWNKLGSIITQISFKKDKILELSEIIERVERIKKIELEAILALKEAI